MQSNVTHSAGAYEALGWLEQHKKQLIIGAGVAAFLAFVICLMVYLRGEKVVAAGQKLAAVQWEYSGGRPEAAPAYLKIARDYPSTPAGAQAVLLAAGAFFSEGKFDQALLEFQRFVRDYRDNPFTSQAYLGLAACLDAQGKTNDAITAYNLVVNNHRSDAVLPQANFALARLYLAQKTPELLSQARNCLMEVAKMAGRTPLGQEAQLMVNDLEAAHPELAPKPTVPAGPALGVPRAPGP